MDKKITNNEQKLTSNKQEVTSNEQKLTSNGQRAKSRASHKLNSNQKETCARYCSHEDWQFSLKFKWERF